MPSSSSSRVSPVGPARRCQRIVKSARPRTFLSRALLKPLPLAGRGRGGGRSPHASSRNAVRLPRLQDGRACVHSGRCRTHGPTSDTSTWRVPMPETRSETPLLIAFVDLTRFAAQSQRVGDVELADTLDAFYARVGASVRDAGGRVIKYMGDGVLIAFEEDQVDRGVETLLAPKEEVDEAMDRRGWECRLVVKAHFGTAVAGPFGPPDTRHHDVIGKAVNTAVTLDATGVTLSVSAFRKLGPVLRRRFKKHTPPVTYIRL